MLRRGGLWFLVGLGVRVLDECSFEGIGVLGREPVVVSGVCFWAIARSCVFGALSYLLTPPHFPWFGHFVILYFSSPY